MSTIKFEGKVPEKKNRKNQTYAIEDPEDMTIEELMESIRDKIRRIQKSKQHNSHIN